MDRRLRMLSIGLALSLALNLFLGGAIASWSLRGRGARPRGPGGGGQPEPRLELSPEQRQSLLPGRRALRAARKQLQLALRSDPLDETALEESLRKLRDGTQQTQEAMHAVVLKKAKTLGPERRRRLLRLTQGPGARSRRASGRRRAPEH